MAFCRLVAVLLVLSAVQAIRVPAFLWGDLAKSSEKSNPLTKISVDEFNGILNKQLLDEPFTVIFQEETLSPEDFSAKNVEGETLYPFLHANIGKSLYLPSVESPLRVLNKLADPEKVDHVTLTENGLSAEIEPEGGKFLFINLKDAREGESRSALLRRHNDFMQDMYSKLEERYGKVVAVYTGHYPSWTVPETHSRVRRQAQTQTPQDYQYEGLRLNLRTVLLRDGSTEIPLVGPNGAETKHNDTLQQMDTTLFFENTNITLNFIDRSGYWFWNTVTVTTPSKTESLRAETEVHAILGFSYMCGQNVSFFASASGGNTKVTFQDMQIQPYFNSNNTGHIFGDPYYCVGFFSGPIWAGLFVVFILLSITFFGIMMMMDIRTMDRFDDPKGKTITINAVD